MARGSGSGDRRGGLYMLVEMHVVSISFPPESRGGVKVCAVQLGRSSSKMESTKRSNVDGGSGVAGVNEVVEMRTRLVPKGVKLRSTHDFAAVDALDTVTFAPKVYNVKLLGGEKAYKLKELGKMQIDLAEFAEAGKAVDPLREPDMLDVPMPCGRGGLQALLRVSFRVTPDRAGDYTNYESESDAGSAVSGSTASAARDQDLSGFEAAGQASAAAQASVAAAPAADEAQPPPVLASDPSVSVRDDRMAQYIASQGIEAEKLNEESLGPRKPVVAADLLVASDLTGADGQEMTDHQILVAALKKRVELAESEVERVKKEKQDLEDRNAAYVAQIEAELNDARNASGQGSAVLDENAALKATIEEKDVEVDALMARLEKSKSEAAYREKQVEELSAQLASLRAENNTLKLKSKEADREIQALLKEKESLLAKSASIVAVGAAGIGVGKSLSNSSGSPSVHISHEQRTIAEADEAAIQALQQAELKTKQADSLRAAMAKLKVRVTEEESRAEAAEKAQFELQAQVDEREHIIDELELALNDLEKQAAASQGKSSRVDSERVAQLLKRGEEQELAIQAFRQREEQTRQQVVSLEKQLSNAIEAAADSMKQLVTLQSAAAEKGTLRNINRRLPSVTALEAGEEGTLAVDAAPKAVITDNMGRLLRVWLLLEQEYKGLEDMASNALSGLRQVVERATGRNARNSDLSAVEQHSIRQSFEILQQLLLLSERVSSQMNTCARCCVELRDTLDHSHLITTQLPLIRSIEGDRVSNGHDLTGHTSKASGGTARSAFPRRPDTMRLLWREDFAVPVTEVYERFYADARFLVLFHSMKGDGDVKVSEWSPVQGEPNARERRVSFTCATGATQGSRVTRVKERHVCRMHHSQSVGGTKFLIEITSYYLDLPYGEHFSVEQRVDVLSAQGQSGISTWELGMEVAFGRSITSVQHLIPSIIKLSEEEIMDGTQQWLALAHESLRSGRR